MKKIIWLTFAVLAALWTGLVAITLQLADWVLATIATAQVPGAAALQSTPCLLYTSPSPRDQRGSRMPSSA